VSDEDGDEDGEPLTFMSERSQLEWNRAGFKKIDEHVVKGTHVARKVAIRFDKHNGHFGASVDGGSFVAPTFQSLEKLLRAHVDAHSQLVFHRYIDVRYVRHPETTRGTHRGSWSRSYRVSGDERVVGIELEFDVFDVSEPFETAGVKQNVPARACVWQRLKRSDFAASSRLRSWEPSAAPETLSYGGSDRPEALIPYTDARFETLCAIQAGIAALDAKLNEIVGDAAKGEKALVRLDGLDPRRLLGGG